MGLLGNMVKLAGFEGFLGGIEPLVPNQESLHAMHEHNEIMFHVSNLLPKDAEGKQVLIDYFNVERASNLPCRVRGSG